MFKILHELAAIAIAAVIVLVAWTWTPECEFKDRVRARDPVGAAESLNPNHWLRHP